MKLLKKLLTILLATSGALFTVYQFNLDMKLVGCSWCTSGIWTRS